MTKRQKVFRLIGQAAGITLFIALFWYGVRENNYLGLSRITQPEMGRTVPHQVKGILVYISQEDHQFDVLLGRVGIGSGLLLAICVVLSGELSRLMRPKVTQPPVS